MPWFPLLYRILLHEHAPIYMRAHCSRALVLILGFVIINNAIVNMALRGYLQVCRVVEHKQNHLEGLFKAQMVALPLEYLVHQVWGRWMWEVIIYISHFPGLAEDAGLGTTLWEPRSVPRNEIAGLQDITVQRDWKRPSYNQAGGREWWEFLLPRPLPVTVRQETQWY